MGLKYQNRDRCDQEGLSYIPIAVDTFGGWDPTSLDALSKLGRGEGREEEEVVRQLRQRLRGLLTRDNVAMMGSKAQTIPPAEVDGAINNDYV